MEIDERWSNHNIRIPKDMCKQTRKNDERHILDMWW